MTDRDLIKKLGNLKEIKPEASWLKANRDSLFTQISNSGAKNISAWSSFIIDFKSVLKTVSAPAVALASLILVVVASSAYGHLLLSNTKPNQSLYIARELSEQAKLTTILNSDAREKMAVQFAANNAQDITTVLSDPTFNNEEEIAKLNLKFSEEIKTVKNSVAKREQPIAQIVTPEVATNSDEVFSATVAKDETGVSLVGVATSSDAIIATSTSTTTKILEEAQSLFSNKKYKEAGEVLNQIDLK